jgi:hypothetical protein
MTLNDVPWDGASFDDPPYWGVRGIWWLDARPNWGLMVDYNHAKVIADQGAVVSVSGTRDGVPVGPKDRVGNTFDIMECLVPACRDQAHRSGYSNFRVSAHRRCGRRSGGPGVSYRATRFGVRRLQAQLFEQRRRCEGWRDARDRSVDQPHHFRPLLPVRSRAGAGIRGRYSCLLGQNVCKKGSQTAADSPYWGERKRLI